MRFEMNCKKEEVEMFVCLTANAGRQDWPKQNAKEFMKWFEDQLKNVPAEYADKAFVQIDCGEYEDDDYRREVPTISISYIRPETQEEKEKREAKEKFMNEDLEKRQYQTWLELSKKFGQKGMATL
jgi:hypothetical protein